MKAKVKKCVMETEAAEVGHRPGVWEFTVGKYVWQWDQNSRFGLNTAVARLDDPGREWQDVLFCKTIDHAVMFAWGYHSGSTVKA